MSAIWHGFYGGYYITFLTFFLLAHFSTLTFKLSKFSDNIMVKYYNKSQPYGRWILLIFLTFYFGQTGVTFIVLSLPQCFRILKGIYFAPQLLLLLGIGVTQVLLVNESRRRQKQKKTWSYLTIVLFAEISNKFLLLKISKVVLVINRCLLL